jgi:hypothetical protein
MALAPDSPELCEPLIVYLRPDIRRASDPDVDPWQIAVNQEDNEAIGEFQDKDDAIQRAKELATNENRPGVIITNEDAELESFWSNDEYWEKRLFPPAP